MAAKIAKMSEEEQEQEQESYSYRREYKLKIFLYNLKNKLMDEAESGYWLTIVSLAEFSYIYICIYIYMYISFNMYGVWTRFGTCNYNGTMRKLTDVVYIVFIWFKRRYSQVT